MASTKSPELKYEVDDKVAGQLGTLNKGFLAKPQFWVMLAVFCVIAYLIFRRQQLKKEKQAAEEAAPINDPEAQNEQQLDQVETGSVKSEGKIVVEERVAEIEAVTNKE